MQKLNVNLKGLRLKMSEYNSKIRWDHKFQNLFDGEVQKYISENELVQEQKCQIFSKLKYLSIQKKINFRSLLN